MIELGKNTVLSVIVATLMVSSAAIFAATKVIIQVQENTTELAAVVKSLELSRIDRMIANAEAEIRELDRYLMEVPKNELLIRQKASLQSELIKHRAVRSCVVANEEICE